MKSINQLTASITLALFVIQFSSLSQMPTASAESAIPSEQSPAMEGSSLVESDRRNEVVAGAVNLKNEIWALSDEKRGCCAHVFVSGPGRVESKPGYPIFNVFLGREENPSADFQISISGVSAKVKVYDPKKDKIYYGVLDSLTNQVRINQDGVSIFIEIKMTEKGASLSVFQIDDGKTVDRYAFTRDGRLIRHKSKVSSFKNWTSQTDWTYDKIDGGYQAKPHVKISSIDSAMNSPDALSFEKNLFIRLDGNSLMSFETLAKLEKMGFAVIGLWSTTSNPADPAYTANRYLIQKKEGVITDSDRNQLLSITAVNGMAQSNPALVVCLKDQAARDAFIIKLQDQGLDYRPLRGSTNQVIVSNFLDARRYIEFYNNTIELPDVLWAEHDDLIKLREHRKLK